MPEFAEIYRRYFDFVWSCTRRLGVADLELDDVVQEVFIVIHARLSSLENAESVRSWIYGIVRRTVSTYHRAKRAKVANVEALEREPEMQYQFSPSPLALVEQNDEVRLLWSLLEQIGARKREVFVLAELEEMTVPEIALALEIPLNTVYSRLRAARQELEDALSRHLIRTSSRGRS